jgi:hypothetical protein
VILRIVLLAVLVGFGLLLGWVGVLGWRERLNRLGRIGVRTSAALRDDAAFRLANRVAGLPTLVAGAAAVLGGIAAFGLPTTGGAIIAAVIGFVGAVGISRAGGVLGDRAAAALPALSAPTPKATPDPCAGCACGGCALTSG